MNTITEQDIQTQLEKNRREAQYVLGTFVVIDEGD